MFGAAFFLSESLYKLVVHLPCLFINIGKNQNVKPGDILGAIAGESGMPGKQVGSIDMYDKYTFVEVPREYGRTVLEAMKNAKIKGRSVNIEPANQK